MPGGGYRTKIEFLFIGFFASIFLFCAQEALAATLYFSPSSGSFPIGKDFSVSVFTSSADQSMNAASGVVYFPQDQLEVTSISKVGSIMSLWIQEPTFSNESGTINFEGIILNPGFSGQSGKIITINFHVKAAGLASLTFASGTILANDGEGTNILTGMSSAQFALGQVETIPAPVDTTLVGFGINTGLPAPQIYSSTHPDSNKWYVAQDVKLGWSVPVGITAVRLLINKLAVAVPTVRYSPPVSSKTISNLGDGIWYFHACFQNNGSCGPVANFRIQIDTEEPSNFKIQEIARTDPTDPRAKFKFTASDKISGIDYFDVKIDESTWQAFQIQTENYVLPPVGPGHHTLIVKAVDQAGNASTVMADFTVLPIESPKFAQNFQRVINSQPLIISGTTYASSTVDLWLQEDNIQPEMFTVKSDPTGNFVFTAPEKLKDGIYKAWAIAVDSRGAQSLPTDKITIAVSKSIFLRISDIAFAILSVVVPLVALLVLLVAIVGYGWRKCFRSKKSIRKEIKEAEMALRQAFDVLRDDVESHVKILENTRAERRLSPQEEKILGRLRRDLKRAEKYVKKEIEDIESEIK